MNNPIFFTIGLGQWHLIRKSEVDENLDENQKSFSALGGNRFLPEKWGVVRVFNHPKSRSKRLVQSECSEVCEKWEWCEWCEWCEWDSQTSSMVKLPSRGLNMGPGTGTDQGLDAPVTCHDSTINGGWFYGQIGDGWWLKQLKPEKEHFFPRTGRNLGELVAVSPEKTLVFSSKSVDFHPGDTKMFSFALISGTGEADFDSSGSTSHFSFHQSMLG